MAYFPLLINLNGKKCVIIGGGKVAARKAKVLGSCGANITVIAPDIKYDFDGCCVLKRSFNENDISDAFLIIAATDNRELNKKIAELASSNNIFVNVADSLDESSVTLPAIYHSGSLSAAISTEGKSPYVSRKIRDWLAENIPPYFNSALERISAVRGNLIGCKNASVEYKRIFDEEIKKYEDRNKTE